MSREDSIQHQPGSNDADTARMIAESRYLQDAILLYATAKLDDVPQAAVDAIRAIIDPNQLACLLSGISAAADWNSVLEVLSNLEEAIPIILEQPTE